MQSLAMVEVFIPQKSAKTTNQGFCLLESQLLSLTSTPLYKAQQHPVGTK